MAKCNAAENLFSLSLSKLRCGGENNNAGIENYTIQVRPHYILMQEVQTIHGCE